MNTLTIRVYSARGAVDCSCYLDCNNCTNEFEWEDQGESKDGAFVDIYSSDSKFSPVFTRKSDDNTNRASYLPTVTIMEDILDSSSLLVPGSISIDIDSYWACTEATCQFSSEGGRVWYFGKL